MEHFRMKLRAGMVRNSILARFPLQVLLLLLGFVGFRFCCRGTVSDSLMSPDL